MTMLTPALVLEALGILGVVIYMVAYVFLNAGYITGHGYHYTLMNMAAAICVLASLSQSLLKILMRWPILGMREQDRLEKDLIDAMRWLRRRPVAVGSMLVREPVTAAGYRGRELALGP